MVKYSVKVDIESPHFIEMVFSESVIFYFSTEKRKQRFSEKVFDFIDSVNATLEQRYHVSVDCGLMSAISLYQSIEPNGFCIEVGGAIYRWQGQMKLGGVKVI